MQPGRECFQEAGFHWTYWTYKAVKNHMFPDGIYSYFPNGNLEKETDPEGNETSYTYNAYGQVLTKSDANGNITEYFPCDGYKGG